MRTQTSAKPNLALITGPDLLLMGPRQTKMWGPLIYEYIHILGDPTFTPPPTAFRPGSESSRERTGQGARKPWSKRARERKFQGANWPGSYWLRGANWPGAKRLGTLLQHEIIFWCFCGDPLFVGPLFGQTC